MTKNKIIAFLFLILLSNSLLAEDIWEFKSPWREPPDRGWFFYNEKKPEEEEKARRQLLKKEKTATEWVTEKRKQLEEALNDAIKNPDDQEKVAHYLQLQKQISDMTQKFSETWQKVLLQHPELDPNVTGAPSSHAARQIFLDNQFKEKQILLKQLTKNIVLYFIFKGGCPYCHRFATTVENLKKEYGFKVVPVSLDGKSIPLFPNPQKSHTFGDALKIKFVPAIAAYDARTKKAFPIAHGMISEDELIHRLVLLKKDFSNEKN